MNTINRTLLVVTPKKPYLDWVKSFEKNESGFDTNGGHYSAYLISEKYNEWFDTHACDTVFDLSKEPIEIEEF